jgi:acetoacetyl-CoA synthetase
MSSRPLWSPTQEQIASANLTAFIRHVQDRWKPPISDYVSLYRWSIDKPELFWEAVWEFCGVIASQPWDRVVSNFNRMPGANWFPGARLNYAENLLRRRDDRQALVFWNEQGFQRALTYAELYRDVARLAESLRALGLQPGDRVAAFMPNLPETVVAMLAAASLGTVWSSCSPDFGLQGALDRFGQIEPRVLFAADGYLYNGREFDSLERVAALRHQVPSVERVVVVPNLCARPDLHNLSDAILWNDFLRPEPSGELVFEQLPFDHPLYILFSSGTTGPPKCIVHGAGGILVQHLKEHVLHCDLKQDDRVFFFTTCGWMMWNWLVSALAEGSCVLLYDGSPLAPDPGILFRMAEQERMSIFGTSPKFLTSIEKAGLTPGRDHDLSHLRVMLSTGSPLSGESFDYVYSHIKSDVQLSSMSGGTDLCASFATGDPIGPVYRDEMQCRALGLNVQVFNDAAQPVREQKGELVCTAPFPSMPLSFWHDAGEAYHKAYFARFPGVWCHGDYAELTEHDGVVIYGRSDAVLNPGGVRIGTAEIYRQVEQLPEVLESVVVGQEWQRDVRVILFVKLRPEVTLDDALTARIKHQIRANTTPRHVPARILQVADIPRTKSGKIVELAIRDVIHGRPVRNAEALANAEALELFRNLPELKQ